MSIEENSNRYDGHPSGEGAQVSPTSSMQSNQSAPSASAANAQQSVQRQPTQQVSSASTPYTQGPAAGASAAQQARNDYWASPNQGVAGNAAGRAQATAPLQGSAQTSAYRPVSASTQQTRSSFQGAGSAPAAQGNRVAATAGGAKSNGLKTFLLGFAGAALALLLFWGVSTALGRGATTGGTTTLGATTNTTINASDDGETRAEAVSEKTLPSVVAIDVYTQSGSYGSYFGSSGNSNSLVESSLGSGVIISTDGYILTNYHVIEGADKLMVTAGGVEYEATVAGTDQTSDLAVIKIDAQDLTAIEIGSSEGLKTGQWVMTVGSPFGLEQSVATGIVSATSRTVAVSDSSSGSTSSSGMSVYADMIQTDAAINPGNSGGALVDENGKLIGINSVIESYSGNYSGVGFAIPVDYAMNIASQIIDGKTPTHAQLGVATTSIDSSVAQRYGLGASYGAYVSKVYNGTGAAEAGLQQGDIITKINDTKVESATDLTAAVRVQSVGAEVTITYLRDGSEQTAQVTLGSDEDSSTFFNENSGTGSNGSSGSNGGSSNIWNYLFGDGSGSGSGQYGYGYGYGGSGDGGYGYGYGGAYSQDGASDSTAA